MNIWHVEKEKKTQHNTTQHNTTQHNTTQHNKILGHLAWALSEIKKYSNVRYGGPLP